MSKVAYAHIEIKASTIPIITFIMSVYLFLLLSYVLSSLYILRGFRLLQLAMLRDCYASCLTQGLKYARSAL